MAAELLRLADEEQGDGGEGAAGETAAARLDQVGDGGRSPEELPVGLGFRVAGATAAVACLTLVRVAMPHLQRAVRIGDSGSQAILTAAVLLALGAAPVAGRLADRIGRARAAALGLAGVAGTTALAAAAPSVTILAALVAAGGVAAALIITADLAALGTSSATAIAWYALALPAGIALGAGMASGLEALGAGWRALLALSLLAGAGLVPLVKRPADPRHPSVAVGITAQRVRRLSSTPALTGIASVAAFAIAGAPALAASLLRGDWHQAFGGRGHTLLAVSMGSIAGCAVAGLTGERVWRAGSAAVLRAIAIAIALFGLLLAAGAAAPSLWEVELAWALAVGSLAAGAILAVRAVAAVALPEGRATTIGVLAAYGVAAGGIAAPVILGAVAHAADPRLALVTAGLACGAVAAVIWRSGSRLARDVAMTATDVSRRSARSRSRPAALEISHVNFAYGNRQVLFEVSLEVDEGEVAALLGANGAGKSTLLRLIAGLDHPSSGTITTFGRDTTYVEAEQQVAGGVSMLAGGRMSFPGLTVAENLRIAGHSFRRDRSRLAAAIDEVTQLFPVLGDRMDQRVGTLSGGEQQMLALGRVLLARPRLLVIDELSLGLAPLIVEVLLGIIRHVNEQGTTVLLVEQSANLALSIAGHAFFLERGEVRFDGATADLMDRDDLLRPVFLSAPRA